MEIELEIGSAEKILRLCLGVAILKKKEWCPGAESVEKRLAVMQGAGGRQGLALRTNVDVVVRMENGLHWEGLIRPMPVRRENPLGLSEPDCRTDSATA